MMCTSERLIMKKGKEGYVRKVDQEEYVVYIQVKKVM